MNAFISLITDIIVEQGVHRNHIFYNKSLQLPGYFRATKEWDLLVIVDGQLVAALETKSQVGPSFGNNFNNRTEEALGSAVDLWTAYREGALKTSSTPWIGYLFLLEDCPKSQSPVKVDEPHFKVFPEFVGASYSKRYELLCDRLVKERHYTVASYLLSNRKAGLKGQFSEPSSSLTFELFVRSLKAHVGAFGTLK